MQHYDQPVALPVIPVELGTDERKALEDHIHREVEQALADRKGLEKSWEIWTKLFNARDSKKNEGGDADLDMPSIFKMFRQEAAKVIAPLFKDKDLFVCKPKGPGANLIYRGYQKISDYVTDKGDILNTCMTWYRQARVMSHGVIKVGWTVEKETALSWEDVVDPMAEPTGIATAPGKQLVEKEVTVRIGSFPEVVPIEDFIYPWYATDIYRAPWICHRTWPTRDEIQDKIDAGHLPANTLQIIGDPQETRPKMFALEQMNQNESKGDTKQYQLCEVYMDWRVQGKKRSIIAYYEHKSGKLIHVVHNWLKEYRRPFVDWTGEERDDGVPGVSLSFRLEPLHRAKSTSVRQRLDAATLANQVLIFVNSASDLAKQFPGGKIKGGMYFTSSEVEKDIKQLKLSAPEFQQMANFEQVFDNDMMLVSGLADPDFGQEGVDRPTATSTLKVVELGGLPADLMRESFRKKLALMQKMRLARYRQFYPDGMETILLSGDKDVAEAASELVQWPDGFIEDNIIVETAVTSANLNKTLRKQEKLALADKLPQVYQFMLTLAQAASTPGPLSFFAQKLLVGYAAAVKDWLIEFEIENVDEIMGNLEGALNAGQVFTQALAQAQQQMAQLQSDNTALAQSNAQLGGTIGMVPPRPTHAPGVEPFPGNPEANTNL